MFYTDVEEVEDQPLLPSSFISGYDSLEYVPSRRAPSERCRLLLPSSGTNDRRISSYQVDEIDERSGLPSLSGYNTLEFSPSRRSQSECHHSVHQALDSTVDRCNPFAPPAVDYFPSDSDFDEFHYPRHRDSAPVGPMFGNSRRFGNQTDETYHPAPLSRRLDPSMSVERNRFGNPIDSGASSHYPQRSVDGMQPLGDSFVTFPIDYKCTPALFDSPVPFISESFLEDCKPSTTDAGKTIPAQVIPCPFVTVPGHHVYFFKSD
jgi:hypothetical protein